MIREQESYKYENWSIFFDFEQEDANKLFNLIAVRYFVGQ